MREVSVTLRIGSEVPALELDWQEAEEKKALLLLLLMMIAMIILSDYLMLYVCKMLDKDYAPPFHGPFLPRSPKHFRDTRKALNVFVGAELALYSFLRLGGSSTQIK